MRTKSAVALIAAAAALAGVACAHQVGKTLGLPDKTTPGASKSVVKSFDGEIDGNAQTLMAQGRDTFRYDTFGDEQFWGDTIHLHRAIGGEKHAVDGVGAGITPKQALALGLKVDIEKLPGDNPVWRTVKRNLSYAHLPSPALQLTPKFEGIKWYR